MKIYNFKKTDITKGNLMSSDKHLKNVQQRFNGFIHEVHDIFQAFLDKLFYDYRRAMNTVDSVSRNPIHYAALSKYTKYIL